MRRYLIRAHIEPSPEVLSALGAASLTVHEVSGDGDLPDVTVEIDPSPGDGTLNQLLDALSRPQRLTA